MFFLSFSTLTLTFASPAAHSDVCFVATFLSTTSSDLENLQTLHCFACVCLLRSNILGTRFCTWELFVLFALFFVYRKCYLFLPGLLLQIKKRIVVVLQGDSGRIFSSLSRFLISPKYACVCVWSGCWFWNRIWKEKCILFAFGASLLLWISIFFLPFHLDAAFFPCFSQF